MSLDFKGLAERIKQIANYPLVRRTTCPVDGFPLEADKRGEPWCPFCGWPWPKRNI